MSEQQLKTLRDYRASALEVDGDEILSARDGYGGEKYTPNNTNEAAQDASFSEMINSETKPFAFALGHGEDGATIYYGCLLASITTIRVKRENGKNYFLSQDPISTTSYIPANNLPDVREKTELGWWGNVYAYWEADENGNIYLFDIRGPDLPAGQDISELNEDLTRAIGYGRYYVLIGTVLEEDRVIQHISSDIPWFVTILSGPDGSSSSSGLSSGSLPSEGSDTTSDGSQPSEGESEKSSNAIVAAPWTKGKHVALATVESNQVLFEFVVRDIPIRGSTTIVRIDPRFLYVCEPGSMCVASAPCGDLPYPVGASVNGGALILNSYSRKDRRPSRVNVRLTGIRKGFRNWDMPNRTAKQKAQSEEARRREYDRNDQ